MQDTNKKDIVIKGVIVPSDSISIYEKIVSPVIMTSKYKPTRYHVTIGYIKKVHIEDTALLIEYLNTHLLRLRESYSEIIFEVNGANLFAGKIAFTPSNPQVFSELNIKVAKILLNFQSIFNIKYSFDRLTQNINYFPHITIGAGDRQALKIIQDKINNVSKSVCSHNMRIEQIVAHIMI
jgi:2'-5' RNA ligase